ncbi:MAG: anti-sigma factor family protein, partial [Thiohalocapsa sp.]
MQKHSDEALVAYLDGELDEVERRHVEAWLDADPAVRDRLEALSQSAALLREAYAEFHDAPVPETLIGAARGDGGAAGPGGQEAEIVLWQRPGRGGTSPRRG